MISRLIAALQRRDEFGPGLYHYRRENEGERSRLHLRVSPDGSGILMLNASRVLHLNPTAARMAWLALEGVAIQDAVRELQHIFEVPAATAEADFREVAESIQGFAQPNGPCPIHDLDFELLPPFSKPPEAPYRMDLAITYRCNENCPHCYNARPRDYPEIDRAAWFSILSQLRDIGIPHICFTGGEATLREDLPDLIAYAQRQGQIVGLLTNGRRLADRRYLAELVAAGLDHVQITIESSQPSIHDHVVATRGAWKQTVAGIRNAVASELYVMTNTTLLAANAPGIGATIDWLASLGVPTVGCNALIYSGRGRTVGTGIAESNLAPLLDLARTRTSENDQRLVWYTPTQYCSFDPVQFDLGVKGCTAARYNMCVEPDGAVIPCQSYYHSLGNLLTDSWESIWNHDLALHLRERRYLPDHCLDCAVVAECGGGCPLAAQHQAVQMEVATI